jgi:CxxC motif-containing protein (DUF1111 family)
MTRSKLLKMLYKHGARTLIPLWICSVVIAAQTEFQNQQAPLQAYNATSCAACHSAPATGGSSAISITRFQFKGGPPPSASQVLHSHKESILPERGLPQERRVTLNLMGDGLIEALGEKEIIAAASKQEMASNGRIHGQIVRAPIMESTHNTTGIGKFGWKAQHSSLMSSCADSMLNELGVPNPLYDGEAKVHPNSSATLDKIVEFVRSLPPPSRDTDLAQTEDAQAGEVIFDRIGCALCHVPSMRTLPARTVIDGGTYRVPEVLGGKVIHAYSDFLLHDVGTGDGMLQAATPEYADPSTANKFRTPPLWGIRFRSWMMHDGKAATYHQAIMRHGGEASEVRERYERLTPVERDQLQQFLNSL